MEELKRFENDLRNNEELRKKLEAACKRIADEDKADSDGEAFVKAAKELGYDISIAALEQSKAEAEQLDPEALAEVTGGDDGENGWCVGNYRCLYEYHAEEDANGHNVLCLAVWHCFTAALHTGEGEHAEACWKDYKCIFSYKCLSSNKA